jgi:MFS family permease
MAILHPDHATPQDRDGTTAGGLVPPGERAVFAMLYTAILVEMVFFIVLGPLLPDFAAEFDLSTLSAGLLSASYSLGCGIAAIPAGLLAARFGARPVTVAGLTLVGSACAGFALAGGVVWLDLARTIQGVGAAALWAGSIGWLLEMADGAGRGRLVGFAFSAAGIGATIGPAVGALAASVGSQTVFLALSAFILALAVTAATLARRRPGRGFQVAAPRIRGSLSPGVRHALVLVAMPSLGFGMAGVLVPLRLHHLGASVLAISVAYVVASLLEAVLSPIVGRWYDRRGSAVVVRVTLLSSAAAMVALSTGLPEAALLIGLALAWPTLGNIWVPSLAELTKRVEATGAASGVALGLFNLCWSCFQALGALTGTRLASIAVAVPFLVLAAIYVVVALVPAPRTAAAS